MSGLALVENSVDGAHCYTLFPMEFYEKYIEEIEFEDAYNLSKGLQAIETICRLIGKMERNKRWVEQLEEQLGDQFLAMYGTTYSIWHEEQMVKFLDTVGNLRVRDLM